MRIAAFASLSVLLVAAGVAAQTPEDELKMKMAAEASVRRVPLEMPFKGAPYSGETIV